MAKVFKEKECELCGEIYTPTCSSQKYCVNCKEIVKKIHNQKYYQKNKEKISKYKKQWRKDNIFAVREYDRQRNKTDKRKEARKQYRLKNKEYYKEYQKTYYENNKNKIKEYKREWELNNKDKIKEYKKEWVKQKIQEDLSFKLINWSRQQIHRCLNYKKTHKSKDKHTFDILGYTPEQLKQRLEMNFKPDMNWSNHGTLWHIDHRKPLCKFNFVLPDGIPNYEQIRLANSLANLQPLYVTENLSKGGR